MRPSPGMSLREYLVSEIDAAIESSIYGSHDLLSRFPASDPAEALRSLDTHDLYGRVWARCQIGFRIDDRHVYDRMFLDVWEERFHLPERIPEIQRLLERATEEQAKKAEKHKKWRDEYYAERKARKDAEDAARKATEEAARSAKETNRKERETYYAAARKAAARKAALTKARNKKEREAFHAALREAAIAAIAAPPVNRVGRRLTWRSYVMTAENNFQSHLTDQANRYVVKLVNDLYKNSEIEILTEPIGHKGHGRSQHQRSQHQ